WPTRTTTARAVPTVSARPAAAAAAAEPDRPPEGPGRSPADRAHRHHRAVPGALHDVAGGELTSAPRLHVAVHPHQSLGDQALRVGTGVDHVGQLQELAQPDRLLTH